MTGLSCATGVGCTGDDGAGRGPEGRRGVRWLPIRGEVTEALDTAGRLIKEGIRRGEGAGKAPVDLLEDCSGAEGAAA